MDFQTLDATVTRTELGLGVLHLNDHVNYILDDEILGGSTSWQRQTTKSPYVDGEFTVNRVLGDVEERISLDVLSDNHIGLQANIVQLVKAFSQARYTLTMYVDDSVWAYDCEAADYTVGWEKTRRMVHRSTVQLLVRRSPKLLTGGY